jgi:hypothetical protein
MVTFTGAINSSVDDGAHSLDRKYRSETWDESGLGRKQGASCAAAILHRRVKHRFCVAKS